MADLMVGRVRGTDKERGVAGRLPRERRKYGVRLRLIRAVLLAVGLARESDGNRRRRRPESKTTPLS